MSEASEKLEGLTEIAIFPLPIVLLPKELLPLHIFEPRYRMMLHDTRSGNGMFGLNFFEPPEEFIDRPAIGSVGCIAEVREVYTLPDQRSNILTLGLERYKIESYVESEKPYLVATIRTFKDAPGDDEATAAASDEVFTLFERVAKAAFKMSGNRGAFPEMPKADPETLSFLITAAFSLDNPTKYEFLEMGSTLERLGRLRKILSEAVDKMEESADVQSAAATNGHGRKKIDL